jgi:dihydroorotate dehydrogenase
MLDPYRFLMPLLRRLDPERAHRLALWGLKTGLVRAFYPPVADDPVLATNVWGKAFANPVGLAAGFDKNAEVPDAALNLGFGFVEVGGVTPLPQPGNIRPRLFRLEADRAVINRMGFNNHGASEMGQRLAGRRHAGPVGVNLGKNKDSPDAAADYSALANVLARHVDFLVINVSSPNTPGLRTLQNVEPLIAIIRATRAARDRVLVAAPPPLLLKIAPDLAAGDVEDIAKVALAERLDGLVVANTTVSRPDSLLSPLRNEAGGLSGTPLFELSTRLLRRVYELTGGQLPLIGVGGISSGSDAYAKIRAGASLVQFYTAMVFEGPGLLNRIKHDLTVLLKRDGFSSVAAAVGADARARAGRA